ncbi:hypothetical protein SAMN05877753_101431 [Bacillus oleivorans]|uniref:Uncharacterized protein n=1 Tax=Bacillus oleivorans TaxID=1448271 RepID=A0A285CJD4_9BACI|nr:hypothetical protein [Bacillus oleivorans]SNX67116.1 hypothetical protein SAMN05877753_101431 [Bacillus oleivorans]
MIISCTNSTISTAESLEIVRRDHTGLIDTLLSVFRKKEVSTSPFKQSESIYYPYWVIHYHLSFTDRVESMFIVVDGFTGDASFTKGLPILDQVEVENNKLVRCSIPLVKSILLANDFLTDNLIFRDKRMPSCSPVDFLKLYKPYYIYSNEKNGKLIYKAIDAQTGERNYSLDIVYPQLLFEEERSGEIREGNRFENRLRRPKTY